LEKTDQRSGERKREKEGRVSETFFTFLLRGGEKRGLRTLDAREKEKKREKARPLVSGSDDTLRKKGVGPAARKPCAAREGKKKSLGKNSLRMRRKGEKPIPGYPSKGGGKKKKGGGKGGWTSAWPIEKLRKKGVQCILCVREKRREKKV